MNNSLTIEFIYYNVFILYNMNFTFTIKFTVAQFEPEKAPHAFQFQMNF